MHLDQLRFLLELHEQVRAEPHISKLLRFSNELDYIRIHIPATAIIVFLTIQQ